MEHIISRIKRTALHSCISISLYGSSEIRGEDVIGVYNLLFFLYKITEIFTEDNYRYAAVVRYVLRTSICCC